MEKLFGVVFYLIGVVQFIAVDMGAAGSILENEGWHWIYLPIRLASFVMMLCLNWYIFIWAPGQFYLVQETVVPPKNSPPLHPTPVVPVDPKRELFKQPTLKPEAVHYPIRKTVVLKPRGDSASYEVPAAKTPLTPDEKKFAAMVSRLKELDKEGVSIDEKAEEIRRLGGELKRVNDKNGNEIWPLSETQWEREIAERLKGIHCPNCRGIDIGMILYGQLPRGDGRLNHLIRMKLFIPGGGLSGLENLYCNDCESYWVSDKYLSETPPPARGGEK